MARTTDKLKSFESNYEKLEQLVQELDAPDLTLKQSLDLYEKAIKLSQSCEGALNMPARRPRPWPMSGTIRTAATMRRLKGCWTYDLPRLSGRTA